MLRLALAKAFADDLEREIEQGMPADWLEIYEELHDLLLDFVALNEAGESNG